VWGGSSDDDDSVDFHDVHEDHDASYHTGEQSAPRVSGAKQQQQQQQPARRTRLGSYKAFGEVSIWNFLKEALGKDLTRITFPIAFNEPLTLLQRSSEDMEYAQLLDRAAACTESEQRLLCASPSSPSCPCPTSSLLAKVKANTAGVFCAQRPVQAYVCHAMSEIAPRARLAPEHYA
jgi:hypothetical protein